MYLISLTEEISLELFCISIWYTSYFIIRIYVQIEYFLNDLNRKMVDGRE